MKRLSMIMVLALVSGCASTDYEAYLKAQSDAQAGAMAAQKPLVRIVARPGEAITGLSSIEVYTPVQAPVIQQARPSEWAGVLGNAVNVLGVVAGIKGASNNPGNLNRYDCNSLICMFLYFLKPRFLEVPLN
jgi:hypothetical protein